MEPLRLKTKRKTQNFLDCINESVYNFIREETRVFVAKRIR